MRLLRAHLCIFFVCYSEASINFSLFVHHSRAIPKWNSKNSISQWQYNVALVWDSAWEKKLKRVKKDERIIQSSFVECQKFVFTMEKQQSSNPWSFHYLKNYILQQRNNDHHLKSSSIHTHFWDQCERLNTQISSIHIFKTQNMTRCPIRHSVQLNEL